MKSAALSLAEKIARLAEERGWNQEEFARRAGLNRHTARKIMLSGGPCKLHNATISACAAALDLSVNELGSLPLDKLLLRMHGKPARQLHEKASQPELARWMEANPGRASSLSPAEVDELLSLQGTGGPLTPAGVEHFVDHIERRRKLIGQVEAVAGTEYLELLEQFVGLLYEKVQPYEEKR